MVEVDPRIDTEIGDYRIEALLRTDVTGRVYVAEDVRLNRRVALRLLSPELAADRRFRERFLRESELVASLDHSNIVPVYETGEVGGHLFVAMGYVDGTGLASLLAREGRLEPERTLLIVTQLAEALDAARWSRGLVHGNLTPSGVLVTSAAQTASLEHVFLVGFGLRQEVLSGATLADAARHFGAVDYLAPEQIEGKSVSPRTDVYTLGCLLFECLTGRPPFKRDAPDAVLKAHLYDQPPSATHYCPALLAGIDRVIGTAMAKWPEERHATCGEFAAAAKVALTPGRGPRARAPMAERLGPVGLAPLPEPAVPEEPTPAPAMQEGSADAPGSLAQRLGRRRTSIAAIGLVVLLVLGAGAIWLARGDGDDVSSATPAGTTAGTPTEPAAVDGAGTTEAPAETGPPVVADAPTEPASEGPPRSAVSLLPGSLVRIDAATGKVSARVSIPFPKLLASDGRSVWVLSDEGASEKLVQVEPATNAVARMFNADTDAGAVGAKLTEQRPTQLAAAGGSAWLGVPWGPVYRFAAGASAGKPTQFKVNAPVGWPVAAAGSLWVRCCEGRGELLRVNPVTERVLTRIAGFDRVLASGTGFMWALDWTPEGDRLVRIDTAPIDTETYATAPIGPLDFQWSDFTVAAGAVWASSPEGGTIRRLDSRTGKERERIRVGREPGALAAGAGAVWAATSRDGTVARYDIATGRVETIDVGGTPNDLVYARGSVWVAVDELAASVNPLTRAQYMARASAICDAASFRFHAAELGLTGPGFEDIEAWNEAAARFSEEAIAELRALPPPKADRDEFIEFYSLLEQQTSVLHQTAEAAWNHDDTLAEELGRRRVELTHQKDGFEPSLQGCPVSLPA